MDNFCTLFNSVYLARGLSLYRSLEATSKPFHLYILCLDNSTHEVLSKLNLANATLIHLADFESPQLLAVKPQRSFAEYCWTCTPAIIKYCLQTYKLETVTYVDADIFFFQSARVLLSEAEKAGASVLLTEHRYTPKYDRSATSGIYCVQFMMFRNDERGQKTLSWWNDRCLEWCFNRFEEGKFGDQKYLDDWTSRFEGVHVLEHLGGGVAPWNVQQYVVSKGAGGEPLVNGVPVVFFHYHNLKILSESSVDLCRTFYDISKDASEAIYRPYVKSVTQAFREIRRVKPGQYDLFSESKKGQVLRLLRRLKGNYYVMEV